MMKKLTTFIIFSLVFQLGVFAQTSGELSVSTSTSEVGGFFAPENILAIWVEDSDGNFVKTLMVYAEDYKTHLNVWQSSTQSAGSMYNDVDAITGPTKTSHATRVCSWNALDYNQNLVEDGTYYLWMELTDKNSIGNYSSFSFEKAGEEFILNPEDVPSFSDITISWEVDGLGILDSSVADDYQIINNPGNGKFEISGPSFDKAEVYSISGKYLGAFGDSKIDISEYDNGIYLLHIHKDGLTEIEKLILRK